MLNRKYKNVQLEVLKVPRGAVTLASNTGVLNKSSGRVTTESLTTAAAGSQALTITCLACSPGDTIFLQQTGGTNTTRAFTLVPVAGAGAFVVTAYNNSASALNGTLIFDFLIVKP